ncbi:MAG: hypothetical protein NTY30_01125 [Candidatus Berkelbacteria bacterium]|nr:hypothetical protein [Candidatus Berkelbacteria bacterium]
MRIAMIFVAMILSASLWAEEKEEVWPELPNIINAEISQNLATVTLDMTIANFRFRHNLSGFDEIAMSWRVIGGGTDCLHKPVLLGLMAIQKQPSSPFRHGEQEIYFQIHYLTSRNSLRYYQPLMAHAGLVPSVEIERWELLTAGSETKILLRGQWNPREHDIGIGVVRKVGKHLEVKLFTNNPHVTVGFSFDLK